MGKVRLTLGEIAGRLGGELINGRSDIVISNVAGLKDAKEGEISFLAHRRYMKELDSTSASAIIIRKDISYDRLPAVKVDNPYFAFSQLLHIFHDISYVARGVDKGVITGKDVRLGQEISIYPYVYIGDYAVIGNNVTIYPFTYIGDHSAIGNNSVIWSNVTIRENCTIGDRVIIHSGAVIGSDGFGYATDKGVHHKIPQVGRVIIEDDVEIGANTTIDRGTIGDTVIRKGTKIDNLIQVAHNVTVGENCLFAAQSGIAGSSKIGNYVIMAGQAGVVDHVNIGNNVIITAQSAATKDTDDGETISGMPAIPHRRWLKSMAVFEELPEIKKRLAELERKLS